MLKILMGTRTHDLLNGISRRGPYHLHHRGWDLWEIETGFCLSREREPIPLKYPKVCTRTI